MKIFIRSLFVAFSLVVGIVLTGCAKKTAVPPEAPAQYHAHTVTYSGETLAVISKWYTGDTENWKAIAKANPKVNPARMQIGTVLQIPMNIVKRTEPLPQKNIPRSAPVTRSVKSRATSTTSIDRPEVSPTPESTTDGPAVVGTETEEHMVVPEAPVDDSVAAREVPSVDAQIPQEVSEVAPEPTAPSDTRVRTRDELLDELLQ